MLLFEPCICIFTPTGNKPRENAEALQDCRNKQGPFRTNRTEEQSSLHRSAHKWVAVRGPVLLPLFSHRVCLDLTSLFQGFLQKNINLSRTRDLWIGKPPSVFRGDMAQLGRGSREGVEEQEGMWLFWGVFKKKKEWEKVERWTGLFLSIVSL